MSARYKAFLDPLPADWKPQPEEWVYIRDGRGLLSASSQVVCQLLPDLYLIRSHERGRIIRKQFAIDDLRPRKERTADDGTHAAEADRDP